jgi:hypothetical protein
MPERHCGDCTLCCRLLPVGELQKAANTRCQHQGHKGCAIYHKPGFPMSCALWSCRWLTGDDTADMLRPDRSRYVLDIIPDMVRKHDVAGVEEIEVVQVWVEPGSDPTKDRRLMRYAERQALRGVGLLLRFSPTRAAAVFAPPMTSDGQWHIVDDARMQTAASPSGNLIVDKLRGAPIDA